MRRLIGRFLVFHTGRLPKKIGIPVRRVGRKMLFGKRHIGAFIGL